MLTVHHSWYLFISFMFWCALLITDYQDFQEDSPHVGVRNYLTRLCYGLIVVSYQVCFQQPFFNTGLNSSQLSSAILFLQLRYRKLRFQDFAHNIGPKHKNLFSDVCHNSNLALDRLVYTVSHCASFFFIISPLRSCDVNDCSSVMLRLDQRRLYCNVSQGMCIFANNMVTDFFCHRIIIKNKTSWTARVPIVGCDYKCCCEEQSNSIQIII